MAALELEGKIKQKLARQTGNSARGEWVRQDFVLEYQDGNFPAEVCLTAFGNEKVAELDKFQAGDPVKVSFNIRAREFNGRWYNDLRTWRITAAGASAPQQAPSYSQPSFHQAPAAPAYSAPAPTVEDMPAGMADDLPF